MGINYSIGIEYKVWAGLINLIRLTYLINFNQINFAVHLKSYTLSLMTVTRLGSVQLQL